MKYDYFDIAIPEYEFVASEMKLSAFIRKELAGLFKHAINDGWDVEYAPLFMMHRQVKYTMTVRLARVPPDDILETWVSRGWNIEPLPEWIRTQLLQIFRVNNGPTAHQ